MERSDVDKLLSEVGKPFTGVTSPKTPPVGFSPALMGITPEQPKTVRRAKAREAFYERLYALIGLAMICGTILAIVWMITQ